MRAKLPSMPVLPVVPPLVGLSLHDRDAGRGSHIYRRQTRPDLKDGLAAASQGPEHADRKCSCQASAGDRACGGGGRAERPRGPALLAGVVGTRRMPLTR